MSDRVVGIFLDLGAISIPVEEESDQREQIDIARGRCAG
jgi:hypothetical protein